MELAGFLPPTERLIQGAQTALAAPVDRPPGSRRGLRPPEPGLVQATPSFFCRLVEEVVYWKNSFLSGKTYR